jgi:hypothetical protein
MRQQAQARQFQAQEAREMQQLNRQASLESSFNQQAAAYGAQSSQMIGQAVGAIGSFAAQGGFKEGAFKNSNETISNQTFGMLDNINTGVTINPTDVSNTTQLGGQYNFGGVGSNIPQFKYTPFQQ